MGMERPRVSGIGNGRCRGGGDPGGYKMKRKRYLCWCLSCWRWWGGGSGGGGVDGPSGEDVSEVGLAIVVAVVLALVVKVVMTHQPKATEVTTRVPTSV